MKALTSQELLPFHDWKWLEEELGQQKFFATKNSRKRILKPPKVASFFGGCGGMDLGLHWAGYELVYSNEIDTAAAATYMANMPLIFAMKSIPNFK